MDDQVRQDAAELLATLRMTYHDGAVAIGADGWFVIIFRERKRPPIIRWKGRPVTYRIGGGIPVANAA